MKPLRTESRSWNNAVAIVLLAAAIFTAFPAQALLIPTTVSQLPPDPGVAGDTTIVGVDINTNSIRDDVERTIFFRYPDNPAMREVLYHMSVWYELMLRPMSGNQVRCVSCLQMYLGFQKALSPCLAAITGRPSQESVLLLPELLNTYDRSINYLSVLQVIETIPPPTPQLVNCSALYTVPLAAPGTPPSITVPLVTINRNTTPEFMIFWGASEGAVTRYEVQRDSNPVTTGGNANQYSGMNLYKLITTPDVAEAYTYKVRACNGNSGCSAFRVSTTPVVVTVTAPSLPPSSITVPSSSTTGNYTVSWAPVTDLITRYELQRAVVPDFSCWLMTCKVGTTCVLSCMPANNAYMGLNLSFSETYSATWPRKTGTVYYRVRACNTAGCSAWRSGGNGVVLNVP